MMMLISSQVVLAQSKFEFRVGAGNAMFIKSPFIEYAGESKKVTLSPLVNLSFYVNATKKTLFGIEGQYELLNKKSTIGKLTDQNGQSKGDLSSIQRKTLVSFGLGGRTYIAGKVLYLGYGYRYAITTKSTNEVGTSQYQQISSKDSYHVPNFSIGVKFTDKWLASPFVEINPAFYIGSKDSYYGIQAKAGVVF